MIGLFGGTFNPVHIGHIRAAIDVRDQLGLTEVRMMPANVTPHRSQPNVSAKQRAAMLKLAIKDIAGLRYEGLELQRKQASYTYDTLVLLRERIDEPIVLLMGADAFSNFPDWYRWKSILKLVSVAVLRRPGSRLSLAAFPEGWVQTRMVEQLNGKPGKIVKVPISRTEVSSTEIRARLQKGTSIRYLVPEAVESYITDHGLYIEN